MALKARRGRGLIKEAAGSAPGEETLERMPPAGEGPRLTRWAQRRPGAWMGREQEFGQFSKWPVFCCLFRVATSSGRAQRPGSPRGALRTPRFPAGAAGVLPRPPPLAALRGLSLRASPSGGAVLLAASLLCSLLAANCAQAPYSARRLTETPEEVRPRTSPGGDGGAAVGAGARARPAVGPAGTAVVLAAPRGGCRRLP